MRPYENERLYLLECTLLRSGFLEAEPKAGVRVLALPAETCKGWGWGKQEGEGLTLT